MGRHWRRPFIVSVNETFVTRLSKNNYDTYKTDSLTLIGIPLAVCWYLPSTSIWASSPATWIYWWLLWISEWRKPPQTRLWHKMFLGFRQGTYTSSGAYGSPWISFSNVSQENNDGLAPRSVSVYWDVIYHGITGYIPANALLDGYKHLHNSICTITHRQKSPPAPASAPSRHSG